MSNGQLLASALAGLGLGLGLIVAIGAQNAFVLRQGIRREHVLPVVLICVGSDAVLIVGSDYSGTVEVTLSCPTPTPG